MGEIQKADSAARRAALTMVGSVAVAGVLLISLGSLLRPAFEGWLEADPGGRSRTVAVALASLTCGPLLVFASYMWHLGSRVRRAGRYPPPGFKVVRHTPVLTGAVARRRARVVQALGGVLAAAALLLAALFWRLASLVPSA